MVEKLMLPQWSDTLELSWEPSAAYCRCMRRQAQARISLHVMAMLAEGSTENMEGLDALMMRRVSLLLRMSNHVGCIETIPCVRDTQLRFRVHSAM